jgi:hypothetical protein
MVATIAPVSIPYGIRKIQLTPYTDATATVLGTPSVNLPYGQTCKFSETEDFDTLRGDDQTVTEHGQGPTGTWELGSGGLSHEAVAILTGATITTTGTTPAIVKSLTKNTSQVRPWFQIEGQAISDTGGDEHIVMYLCKMTDTLDGEFSDGNFFITSCKGIFLGSKVTATVGQLWSLIQNQTAIAPV